MFSSYFTEKISLIRNTLDSMDTLPTEYDSFSGSHLDIFDAVTEDEVKSLISKSLSKHCDLRPLLTVLLKNCIHELIP